MTTPRASTAEELYAAFLERVEAGVKLDIDTFCREEVPPELREQVRRLHETAKDLRGLLRHLVSRDFPQPLVGTRTHTGEGSDVAPEGTPGEITERTEPGTGPAGVAGPPGATVPVEASAEGSRFAQEVVRRLASHTGAFSRYALRGEIARGGMGAILRVWDQELRRHLAMKVVLGRDERRRPARLPARGDDAPSKRPSTPAVDSRTLARFLEEAQVTGQLDHPGIVPVHELGLDPLGRCYFTMKLVKGETLEEILRRLHPAEEGDEQDRGTPQGGRTQHPAAGAPGSAGDAWSQVRILGVLLKVCEAVAYAHAKGVVHRDLKPANIMVGRFGEVYVMDWGLAKVLGDRRGREEPVQRGDPLSASREVVSERGEAGDPALLTRPGTALGTPVYMPPEQAEGRISAIGPPADVYAVGAMLYHLLGGRRPYVDPGSGARRLTYGEVLRRVREGPPRPLERIAPRTAPELLAITAKAMARNPADRYPDMRALAGDIGAYLEGRVVSAYETGTWAELRKWIRRNPAWAFGSAAAILAVVAGTTTFLAVRAANSAAEASQARKSAEAVLGFVQSMFNLQDPARASGSNASIRAVLDRETRRLNTDPLLGDQPLVHARILEILGSMYQKIEEKEEAEPLLLEALRLRREDPAGDPLDTASLETRLGRLYLEGNRIDPAEPLLREALEIQRETRGEEDPSTLEAESDLGLLYQRLGRLAEAEPLLEEASRLSRETLGGEDPRTLRAIHRLGLLAVEQGHLDRAASLLREAFEGSEKALGKDDVDTLALRYDLGLLEQRLGHLDGAETLLREGLRISRRALGEDDPDTIASMVAVGRLDLARGKPDLAEALFQEALHASLGSRGGEDPETIAIEGELGMLYLDGGQEDLAKVFLQEAYQDARRVLGEQHPVTRRSTLRFAKLLLEEDRLEEAEALARGLLGTVKEDASAAERGEYEDLLESIRKRRGTQPTQPKGGKSGAGGEEAEGGMRR